MKEKRRRRTLSFIGDLHKRLRRPDPRPIMSFQSTGNLQSFPLPFNTTNVRREEKKKRKKETIPSRTPFLLLLLPTHPLRRPLPPLHHTMFHNPRMPLHLLQRNPPLRIQDQQPLNEIPRLGTHKSWHRHLPLAIRLCVMTGVSSNGASPTKNSYVNTPKLHRSTFSL